MSEKTLGSLFDFIRSNCTAMAEGIRMMEAESVPSVRKQLQMRIAMDEDAYRKDLATDDEVQALLPHARSLQEGWPYPSDEALGVFREQVAHKARRPMQEVDQLLLGDVLAFLVVPNSFPPRPKPSLRLDDVIGFLAACRAEGHTVYQGDYDHVFILELEEDRITIVCGSLGTTTQVQWGNLYENVETLPQLEKAIAQAADHYGKQWPSRPTSGRLSAATPAANLCMISRLVGSSKVEAVFDPYLENSSLTALSDILSFGGEVANGVRLLGSTKPNLGRIPRFTRRVVETWFMQLGIQGEAKVTASTEHRRFILLSGGQSLILGPSLNSIHKNEATHLEPDAADRTFFDGVWATAAPLT